MIVWWLQVSLKGSSKFIQISWVYNTQYLMYVYFILYTYDVSLTIISIIPRCNYIYRSKMTEFPAYVWKTLQTYNNLTFGYSNLQPSSFDVTSHIPHGLRPAPTDTGAAPIQWDVLRDCEPNGANPGAGDPFGGGEWYQRDDSEALGHCDATWGAIGVPWLKSS